MTMTMANRISNQEQNEGPTPEQARRGRRTAFLLFALGFGPMIVATIMFYTGWLNPAGHTNNGVLLQPVAPVSTLNLETASGTPLAERFGREPDRHDGSVESFLEIFFGALGLFLERAEGSPRDLELGLPPQHERVAV